MGRAKLMPVLVTWGLLLPVTFFKSARRGHFCPWEAEQSAIEAPYNK